MNCFSILCCGSLLGIFFATPLSLCGADEKKEPDKQSTGAESPSVVVQTSAGLGDELTIDFSKDDWEKKVAPLLKDRTKLPTLYLDCLPMNLAPVAVCWEDHHMRFDLERTKGTDADPQNGNEKQWQALLRDLKGRPVKAGIGPAGNAEGVIWTTNTFQLRVVSNGWWVAAAIALTVILALVLVIYGVKSNLLRDLSPRPESEFKQIPRPWLSWLPGLERTNTTGHDRPPFSLGRVQMAFWFFVIIAAYLFLWLVLGERNSFNGTVLTLLGISLSTGLVSRAIDAGKQSQAETTKAERAQLDTRRRELEGKDPINLTPELKAEIERIKARLAEIAKNTDATVPLAEHKSEGFLTDILSDENGMSLHRLQMVGWSLVLGLVFIAEVRNNLSMPTFDNTLLGLMGISSGAFLGFKVPEKKSVPTPQ